VASGDSRVIRHRLSYQTNCFAAQTAGKYYPGYCRGDLRRIVDIRSRDEIGQLSMNFNQMTKSLEKSYADLKQEIVGHKHTEELTLAYDVTIKGWSSALDLRDKETEGHSQRVAEVTVELAQAFA